MFDTYVLIVKSRGGIVDLNHFPIQGGATRPTPNHRISCLAGLHGVGSRGSIAGITAVPFRVGLLALP